MPTAATFGIVAHGDGDAVAGLNALGHQPVGHGRDLGVGLRIGQPFVLIDDVFAVGVLGGRHPQRPDVRRLVLVAAQLLPAHLDLFDLEHGAGRDQLRPGRLQFLVVHLHRLFSCAP
jgi:hypothetical protein